MNVKLFGHRCLIEHYKPKSDSKIVIPSMVGHGDTHRTGIVRYIGDGKVKGKDAPVPSLVKVGDIVVFQINEAMKVTQTYVNDGIHYMNILQDELLARISGDGEPTFDNIELLGDYALLQHYMEKKENNLIVVPDSVARKNAEEYIHFKLVKKGSTFDLPIEVGNEVVVNFGRLTPLFLINRSLGTATNQEYCYTRKEWVDGVIVDAAGA